MPRRDVPLPPNLLPVLRDALPGWVVAEEDGLP